MRYIKALLGTIVGGSFLLLATGFMGSILLAPIVSVLAMLKYLLG